jgi:hypothetical protein
MSTADAAIMQPFTTPLLALESITFDVLTRVSGGCRPAPPPPPPATNVQNVNNVQVQPPVVMPVCMCAPQQPASVESSVEVSYGQTTTTA